jgi:hypothetical protein
VGIKGNIDVNIKGCPPALIDLVIVDMPEEFNAYVILGRPFLRTIKTLINLHEGNVRIELPPHYQQCTGNRREMCFIDPSDEDAP